MSQPSRSRSSGCRRRSRRTCGCYRRPASGLSRLPSSIARSHPSTKRAVKASCPTAWQRWLPWAFASMSGRPRRSRASALFMVNDSVEGRFAGQVGYGIPRTVLHRWLVDRAADCGVALHWGRRITGLSADGLLVEGRVVASRWLICADGQNSKLRKLAGLEPATPPHFRFGFRRHYRVAPWSDFVEVLWSDCGQMYVTPVADDQVCVALITRHQRAAIRRSAEKLSPTGGEAGTCNDSGKHDGSD